MKESPQAIFNTADVLAVDRALLDELKQRARRSPTLRYRFCLHRSTNDAVQEMLLVHCRGNYSRPHRHPPGVASTRVMLEGALAIYIFSAAGEVEDVLELEALGGVKPFAARVDSGIWYMPVARSEQAVWFESMAGPFDPERINEWAPWSPTEDDAAGIAQFLARFA